MSHALQTNKLSLLEDRAHMLSLSRQFFKDRDVLEIDCPILNSFTNIDDHIDPISVSYRHSKKGYLHTSPELFLKKLLALGCKDLYFLGHVFRDHEKGNHHQVEFTMVEWYRQNISFEEMILETLEFIQLFIPPAKITQISYHDALYQYTSLKSNSLTKEQLKSYIEQEIEKGINWKHETESDLLSFIFSEKVEKALQNEELVVIRDYPPEQAALSKKITKNGREVALRFEVYFNGIELANGYDELIGDLELKSRYSNLNDKRCLNGKESLPIDLEFIKANAKLPDCRGVAVGFDRLMMLKTHSCKIQEAMALLN